MTSLERKKQEKLEAERSQRITVRPKRRLPKVNRELAATIFNEEDEEEKKKIVEDEETTKKASKKKKPGLRPEDFEEGRFDALFENPDFQIDRESYEYDDDENSDDTDASQASDEDDERPSKKSKTPKLFEVKDERHAEAFYNRRSLVKEDNLPLGERVKALEKRCGNFRASKDVKFGPGGSREISFNARSSSKYKEDREDRDDEDEDGQRNRRRGLQSLGFKPDNVRGGFRGRGGHGFRGGGRNGSFRGRGGGLSGGGGGGRGGGRGRGRG